MNVIEQLAVVRARLHSLQQRAEASEVVCLILLGQVRRQQTELAAAATVLDQHNQFSRPATCPLALVPDNNPKL